MLYRHWTEVPWDETRWPNFKPDERTRSGQLALACPHCGEFYLDKWMLDGIQFLRDRLRSPIYINSGHRCRLHNVRVGGAEYSRHLRVAWDISLLGLSREQVYETVKEYGYSTFGFYRTFLHTDDRPNRRWFGKGAAKLWNF